MSIFVRHPYNYSMDDASKETALECKDKSLAQQQFKEEADINTLVARYHLTGQMPQVFQPPMIEDYDGIFDFQSAMNAVRRAQETFNSIPANIRARFDNDAAKFHDFFLDPNNKDEAVRLGLVLKPAPAPSPEATGTTPTGGGATPVAPSPSTPPTT